MASEKDTNRMAGELLNALLGSMMPLSTIGQIQPKAQVDEGSMLDTIKSYLNQSMHGAKEQEQQRADGGFTGSLHHVPVNCR